jgi:hypothetical protein
VNLPDFLKPSPYQIDNDSGEFTLRFSPTYWTLVFAALIGGATADWIWLVPLYQGQQVSLNELQFLLVILPIFAIGAILYGARLIRVTKTSIESWHLFSLRIVSRNTSYVLKYTSMGFVISDHTGERIHVPRGIVGAGRLHAMLHNTLAPNTAMEEGIEHSTGMKAIKGINVAIWLVKLLAMLVVASFLVYRGMQDWMEPAKDNPPSTGADIFLVSLGLALIIYCCSIVIGLLVKIRRYRRAQLINKPSRSDAGFGVNLDRSLTPQPRQRNRQITKGR